MDATTKTMNVDDLPFDDAPEPDDHADWIYNEDIETVRAHIWDTAKYRGMSYASIVQTAVEVESFEVKENRAALRREFKQAHALTAIVWARVEKRFPNYSTNSSQTIRAMAYCCQLPKDLCIETFEAHRDHIGEPDALGLVLADVNAELGRPHDRKPKAASLAELAADAVRQLSVIEKRLSAKQEFNDNWTGVLNIIQMLKDDDRVRRVLEAKPKPEVSNAETL